MYATGPYSLAWGVAEIPWIIVQALLMGEEGWLAPSLQGCCASIWAGFPLLLLGGRMPSVERERLLPATNSVPCVFPTAVNIMYWPVHFAYSAWKYL
jgi:hypothetical protein